MAFKSVPLATDFSNTVALPVISLLLIIADRAHADFDD